MIIPLFNTDTQSGDLNSRQISSMDDSVLETYIIEQLASKSYQQVYDEIALNEGFFGSLIGGLTGFALGKKVGEIICKALGISSGPLKDLLTSRLLGAAVGAAIGK
jgi:hypothetical protein